METTSINLLESKDMFLFIAKSMVEKKDELTKADQAIGDGDHGIGMARGFEAVIAKLETQEFNSIGEQLKTIGMALMMSIGGAAGAIFGSFFKAAATSLSDASTWDTSAVECWLEEGLQAVIDRGKAKAGDKTMIDALLPALNAAKDSKVTVLETYLSQIAKAAQEGMENTKNFIATTGKAKTLGERSIGHPDPGSISMYLILKFMNDYTHQHIQAKA